MCMIDNYFFDTFEEKVNESKVYVLVIYDIIDNKKRLKLVKYLNSFGFRVQKSCYEAKLSQRAYDKLMSGIGKYADAEDSIRIYKIIGSGQVTVYGKQQEIDDEEIIII